MHFMRTSSGTTACCSVLFYRDSSALFQENGCSAQIKGPNIHMLKQTPTIGPGVGTASLWITFAGKKRNEEEVGELDIRNSIHSEVKAQRTRDSIIAEIFSLIYIFRKYVGLFQFCSIKEVEERWQEFLEPMSLFLC